MSVYTSGIYFYSHAGLYATTISSSVIYPTIIYNLNAHKIYVPNGIQTAIDQGKLFKI